MCRQIDLAGTLQCVPVELPDGRLCVDDYQCDSSTCLRPYVPPGFPQSRASLWGACTSALVPTGWRCRLYGQCASGLCLRTAGEESGECGATGLGIGDSCRLAAQCVTQLCQIAHEDRPPDLLHASPEYGECRDSFDDGSWCTEDFQCISGLCWLHDPSDRYSGECVQSRLPLEKACLDDRQCASGNCTSGFDGWEKLPNPWEEKDPGDWGKGDGPICLPCTSDDQCPDLGICWKDGLCGIPKGNRCNPKGFSAPGCRDGVCNKFGSCG